MPRRCRLAAAMLLMLCACGAARGVSTQVWLDTSIEDFGKGRPTDVAMGGDGDLRLAPETAVLASLKETCVWALARDGEGNVYAGTGPNGMIYRIAPEGAVVEFFRATEMHVLSLAVGADGTVYAGTAPHGRILRIDPSGQGRTLFDTGTSYVWALLLDGDGNLLAGTGKAGLILRLTPDGRELFRYASAQKHILCLARDERGNVYAGAAEKGVIYRVDAEGRVQALYEAVQPEIQALTLSEEGDELFAATAAGDGPPNEMPEPPQRGPDDQPSGQPKRGENGIYRLDLRRGGAEFMFGIQGMSFYSLARVGTRLYAGSGPQGWVFLIEDDGMQAAVDRPERQVLAALAVDDGVLLGTANDAGVLRLRPGFAAEGTYSSRAFDGGDRCRWGRVEWATATPEGTDVALATRSGNTSEPGDTWSAWEPVGGDGVDARIQSPPARFLQYRAEFRAPEARATPLVEFVRLTYLPLNQPPRVRQLEVSVPGQPATAPSPPRPNGPRPDARNRAPGPPSATGATVISWELEDPNRDELRIDLFARSDEETAWQKLAEEVKGDRYEWRSEEWPDGRYRVLLRVSDLPANTPEDAYTTEQQTEPVIVDHTAPAFADLAYEWLPPRRCRIRGRAADALSRVVSIEYRLEGEEWTAAQPQDGILDGHQEDFTLTTPPLFGREHSILIRATDAAGNVRVTRLVVRPTT